jgi:hypothetical protein
MRDAMNQYMPGGRLPTSSPTFGYNTSADLQGRANNFVAPFSDPSLQAFSATEAAFGQQQPIMNAGVGLTLAGSGNAGQLQGGPDGWTTDPNTGQAVYQDYNTGIGRYMDPFVGNVIGTGLGFLDTARQRAGLATNNDSIAKGSFGGTRQAVRNSLDDTAFAAQAENLINTNLNNAFTSAQGQYNTGFTQGQQALQYNQSTQAQDLARRLTAGAQLTNQAAADQQITGNDINALRNVGQSIESQDQARRDAARASQLQDQTWGLSVAQMLAGLGPPPSSTTSGSTSAGSGSIWGSALGAGATILGAMLSDEKAKKSVKMANPEDSLAEIRKLVPVKFQYNTAGRAAGGAPGERTGFMAQDLEKATGKENPTGPGGFQHVDVSEHLGRLTHAVAALEQRTRGLSLYNTKGGKPAAKGDQAAEAA